MRYKEPELVLPSLKAMAKRPSGSIRTSELINELINDLQPTNEDMQSHRGRGDSKFSQTVRNMKSHNNMIRQGLATYRRIPGDGIWTITQTGENHLKLNSQNIPKVSSLINQGFRDSVRKKEANEDYSDVIIEEGAQEERTIKDRKRSDKLKRFAIEKHKAENNGKLPCVGCGFDFEDKYGERGEGFIEIHHKEVIHDKDIKGSRQKLDEALKDVEPVCSNCHKMIHRRRGEMLSIKELKEIIGENLD